MALTTTAEFIIASGASLSNTLDLGEQSLVRIEMPQAWTTANITFQHATDGTQTTYNNVIDQNGTELTVVATAAQTALIPPGTYPALRFVRLRSGTVAAPVNQGADRIIRVVTSEFKDV